MRRRARQPRQPCRRLRPLPLPRPETPRRRSPPSAARARRPARRGTRALSRTAKTSVRSSFARTRSVCEQRGSTSSPARAPGKLSSRALALGASSPVFAWICKWRKLKHVSNGSYLLWHRKGHRGQWHRFAGAHGASRASSCWSHAHLYSWHPAHFSCVRAAVRGRLCSMGVPTGRVQSQFPRANVDTGERVAAWLDERQGER